ncbi:1-aminocyclopropane-1-carboxylate oxidase homolog 1 [Phtheirospermum japonicum]|uniref:1-aminocyclopropane-1-carboxylate oxidase homolog 1 n=1 Tax=Phtheirospermum japonicum TaxID=374723 RepID=A0A830CFT7_9LAMI|nr:1-aminocyclopropane-1-carboxylate oxidase homolog 1 [Phtheirospermum japonicum]
MAENFDEQQYDAGDRVKMLRAFDETNAGVKGLTDSGLQKVPKIFIRPSDELAQELTTHKRGTHETQIPLIDLSDIQNADGRKRIVEEMKIASETWGFFQVVNHGIPTSVLDGMIDGIRRFNDQDVEEKKKYYSRNIKRRVRFNSSYDLFTSRTASWRDSLIIAFPGPTPNDHHELPASCRESTVEYSKHVEILGNNLLGILSEALGLDSDHLKNMDCSKEHRLHSHYYPACPEPELAIGLHKHSDPGFITILLQSQGINALQVLYQGQWVDIQPTPGGLVVNIGDLLQLVSNGKFKSNKHRAIVSNIGPRISVACFFSGPLNEVKIYGPIKELLSEENPPIYKDIVLGDYISRVATIGLDNYHALDYYKVLQLH